MKPKFLSPCFATCLLLLMVFASHTGAQLSDLAELQAKATQGDADAQCQLGLRYYEAQGVPQDYAAAIQWLQKSADQGFARAQAQLGYLYECGHGTAVNFTEALKWYRKAAEQGSALGMCFLGSMYEQGRSVPQDLGEAAKWFRKGAEGGSYHGEAAYGQVLALGRGVKQDYVEAYKWLRLASLHGYEAARETIREISPRMTRAEIEEGCRRADELFCKSGGEPKRISGYGSGFFVTEDGFFVTNFHVVSNATRIILRTAAGNFPAQLVAADKVNDVALLKAEGSFKPLPLAASRDSKRGDAVFTVGFPNPEQQGFSPKLTDGTISSLVGMGDDPRFFQVNVAIQPGNSGGALVNDHGNVIGIISASMAAPAAYQRAGVTPQNVNFAVKSAYALALLESQLSVATKLKHPQTSKRKFADAVKAAENAAALVFAE